MAGDPMTGDPTATAARRPPGFVACSVHGVIGSAPTLTERSRLLARHYDTVDRGRAETVTQLPGVSFTETFILAVRALPVGWTGTTADLHALVPAPPSPNCWGGATSAAAHQGLLREIARQESELPSTKKSLVRRWERVESKWIAA